MSYSHLGREGKGREGKMAEKDCCYSCSSASETLRWISAVVEFLNTYSFFFRDAHLVNFFRDKLWESLDSDWIECLGKEPVEILLQIPSGLVKHDWPPSLKHFLLTLNSLVFPRQHSHSLQTVCPVSSSIIFDFPTHYSALPESLNP